MTEFEFFRQAFLARLQAPARENETPGEFADRCVNEALLASEEYKDTIDMFDPETGAWSP
jgi:hypothetical protein